VQADRLCIDVTPIRLVPRRKSAENVVQRVGVLGRPGGFRVDQPDVERDRNSTCDFVLQGEKIAHVAVEPLRPQMRVGLGINELRVDADLFIRPLNASFEYISHAQLAANLLCVDRFVPVGERGIARDHEHVLDPRQIGRQILGDPVGKVLLVGVVAEIGERQHHN
jgi:hypothetical protein